MTPSEYLSQNEIDAASLVRVDELNVQQQRQATWPAAVTVARAYLDQLTRSHGITPKRASAVKAALDRARGVKSGRPAGDQADTLAAQLEQDAGAASGRDAIRLKALAATIKGL